MNFRNIFGVSLFMIALSLHCSAQTHFLRLQAPTTSLFVYAGADWTSRDGESSAFGIPLEARLVTRSDSEFGVQTSAIRESVTEDADKRFTTLTFRQGFRPARGFDYWSIETGYMYDHGNSTSRGDAFYTRTRALGGATKLGFDASVTWIVPTESSPSRELTTVYSIGARSQYKRLQWGIDVTARDVSDNEVDDRTSVDLVLMARTSSGGAFHGTVEKRVSGRVDGWYAGIGYEFRFDLP